MSGADGPGGRGAIAGLPCQAASRSTTASTTRSAGRPPGWPGCRSRSCRPGRPPAWPTTSCCAVTRTPPPGTSTPGPSTDHLMTYDGHGRPDPLRPTSSGWRPSPAPAGLHGSLHASRCEFIIGLPRARRIVDLGGGHTTDDRGALVALGYPYDFDELVIVDLPPDDRHQLYKSDRFGDGETERGRVRYEYRSMVDLSFADDASVDLVYSGQSIEHVPEAAGDEVLAGCLPGPAARRATWPSTPRTAASAGCSRTTSSIPTTTSSTRSSSCATRWSGAGFEVETDPGPQLGRPGRGRGPVRPRRPVGQLRHLPRRRRVLPAGLPRQRSRPRPPLDRDRQVSQVARLEHQDGDDPVGPLLVLGVRGVGGDGPLPPQGPLVALDLAGHPVRLLPGRPGARRAGRRRRLAYQWGWVGRPALRGDERVDPVVLDPHQRGLAELARRSRPGW